MILLGFYPVHDKSNLYVLNLQSAFLIPFYLQFKKFNIKINEKEKCFMPSLYKISKMLCLAQVNQHLVLDKSLYGLLCVCKADFVIVSKTPDIYR